MVRHIYTDGVLTVSIAGKISSADVGDTEAGIEHAIDEFPDFARMVIDATGLVYICSLGIRTILSLKKEYGDVCMMGVCTEVYNIFKMTGLTKIMDIERALPKYEPSDDTMVKIYPEGTVRETIDRDVRMSRELFAQGIPTAMTFEMCMVGNRYGLVYEKPVGRVVTDAKKIGEKLRALHEREVEMGDFIPSVRDRHSAHLRQLEDYLGKDAVELLLKINEALPEYMCLLHGNAGPGNMMEQDGELLLATPGASGYGNPIIDLAHLYSKLTKEQKKDFFSEVMGAYYHDQPAAAVSKLKEQIVIMSLVESFLKLAEGDRPDEEKIEKYRLLAKSHVIDKWDEIESRLKFKVDFRQEIKKLEKQRFYTDSEVNIEWIARRLGTNRHYVSDYFNKVMHKSFSEYINALRLDYAVYLMKNRKEKPSQIAYAAGFNNDHTFRRLFKEKYGCTPGAYMLQTV